MDGRSFIWTMIFLIVAAISIPDLVVGLKVRVKPRSEPVWYLEGGSLTLTCIVDAGKGASQEERDVKPEWYRDGLQVEQELVSIHKDSTSSRPKWVLTFNKEDATIEDSGNYRCQAGHDDLVKRVDMISMTTQDVNLTLGSKTTLACHMEPVYEDSLITWLKGQTPLDKIPELDGRVTLGQFNETVTIEDSKRSDAGLYTCNIRLNPDTLTEQSFSRSIGVQIPPTGMTVIPMSEPVWYLEDGTLMLTCIVDGVDKDVRPKWLKDGNPVGNDKVVNMVRDSTSKRPKTILTLEKEYATIDDAASYTCQDGDTETTRQVKMFSLTTRDVNLTVGFQTIMSCDLQPMYTKTSITWLKGQMPMVKIPEMEGRVTLGQSNRTVTILNSKTSDSGIYSCILRFNPGTSMEQSFTQTVGIQGKPHIVSRPSSLEHLTEVTNTSITLTCPATGYPTPEVFWLLGDDVIEASDHYILSSVNGVADTKLEIKDPTIKDHITYVCVAENSMGKSKISLNVVKINNNNNNNSVGKTSLSEMTSAVIGLFFMIRYSILL